MTRYGLLLCLLIPWPLVAQQPEPFAFRVLTTGLENPWEVDWGSDGHLWVTERTGKRITRVSVADGSRRTAATIDEVYQDFTQDGLLGMALHPGLLTGTGDDFVYVSYTYDADPGPRLNLRGKIRRYTFDAAAGTLQAPIDLISNLPAGSDHIGLRLVFGPYQKLYLSLGDQGANWLANFCLPNRAQTTPTAAELQVQNWANYAGKILRLNLDGTVPSDNPTIAGVRSHVFSWGHRNPQGLAFGPDGRLYDSEHGPDTDDEFNLIEAGGNYGWPDVAGYNDERVYTYASWAASSPAPCTSLTFDQFAVPSSVPQSKEGAWSHPDFRPPLMTFFTVASTYDVQTQGSATIAPGGLEMYTTTGPIPGWGDSGLLTSLKSGIVYRVKLGADGTSVVGEATSHFKSTNRYRDLALDPDGRTIYIATDSQGRSTDDAGRPTRSLANPGAIVAFSYAP